MHYILEPCIVRATITHRFCNYILQALYYNLQTIVNCNYFDNPKCHRILYPIIV